MSHQDLLTFWRSDSTARITFLSTLAIIFYIAGVFAVNALQKPLFTALAIVPPIAIVVLCFPRWTLFLFVFTLFISRYVGFQLIPGLGLIWIDLAALLVICSAALDLLVRPGGSRTIPPLTLSFCLVIIAMALSSFLAINPPASFRTTARAGLMLVTFLALCRLLRHVTVRQALLWFFWIGVTHALIAAIPFILSGGQIRSFAFASGIIGPTLAIIVVIGLAFYLQEQKHNAIFGIAVLIALAGLVATQYRAPIAFAIIVGTLLIYVSFRTLESKHQRKRIKSLIVICVCGLAIGLVAGAGFLENVLHRFERLFTAEPGGTTLLRITLWKSAWAGFVDNPIFGSGPGSFSLLSEMNTEFRLNPAFHWIRGLAAHSLILQYMAETGIIGALALLSLFGGQLTKSIKNWKTRESANDSTRLALLGASSVIFITTFIEVGWMWGQASFIAAFVFAMIATTSRSYSPITDEPKRTPSLPHDSHPSHKLRPIFIFLAVDWDKFTRRSMLRALAESVQSAGFKVIAVNRPLCPFTTAVRKPHRLKELLRRNSIKRIAPNLSLIAPKYFLHDHIARRFPFVQTLNTIALRRQLTLACHDAKLSCDQSIIWYYYPQQSYVAQMFQNATVIYEMYDFLGDIHGRARSEFSHLESQNRDRVDLLVTASQNMHNRFSGSYKNAHYLGNGLDRAMFSRLISRVDHNPDNPIANIAKPRVVYTGVISERLDFSLLNSLVRKLPQINFVFVGPATKSGEFELLCDLPNVHYLGKVEATAIPSILHNAELGIMPYLDNAFFHNSNPLKFYEYAAAGLPMISSPVDELRQYSENSIRVLPNDPDQWADAIVALLAQPPEIARGIGSAIAVRHIWEDMTAQLMHTIVAIRQPNKKGE